MAMCAQVSAFMTTDQTSSEELKKKLSKNFYGSAPYVIRRFSRVGRRLFVNRMQLILDIYTLV